MDPKTKYDAIQLCDGMTMMELIRAVTIMPADAVLRLPAIGDGKVLRLRVAFERDDRPWMQEGTHV